MDFKIVVRRFTISSRYPLKWELGGKVPGNALPIQAIKVDRVT
jgi:hypothetical protein